MRWIDKSKNREAGREITKSYLEKYCLQPDGRFDNIFYKERETRGLPGSLPVFRDAENAKFRKEMTELLMEDQNDLCCYCLRKLKSNQDERWSDKKLTLEHIIPRSYKAGSDVSYYATAPGLSQREVELTDIYTTLDPVDQKKTHPHKIAYNNLVVSCNGTFPQNDEENEGIGHKPKLCCNEARGNTKAYPVYFFKEVGNWVDYLKDGDVQAVVGSPKESEIDTLITNTNLQYETLKDIRYLWYLLRGKEMKHIVKCNNSEAERMRLLSEVLYLQTNTDFEREGRIHETFLKENQWKTFMMYAAFHEIMRERYPCNP